MVESKSGYPYVEGEYGIPFKDLAPNTRGIVRGGSGRSLHYNIGSSSIEIEDEEFSGYGLFAVANRNIFKASVFTRRYMTGERHPDFFARRFLIFAYEYFIVKGYKIDRVSTFWPLSGSKFHSVNYEQYLEMLKKGVNPENAAKATWAGRLAGELGFTEVESIVKYKSEGLEAVFKKPDQT